MALVLLVIDEVVVVVLVARVVLVSVAVSVLVVDDVLGQGTVVFVSEMLVIVY